MTSQDRNRKKSSPLAVVQLLVLLLLSAAALTLLLLRTDLQSRQPDADAPAASLASPLAVPTPGTALSVTPETVPDASAAPTATPEPTPLPEAEYFTISMVGDCTLAENYDKRGWGTAYQSVVKDNYAYPFSNTVQFFAEDYLTVANLECILSDKAYSSIEWYHFLAPAAYANILTQGQVDFVTLANNHTQDYGPNAYNDTTAALDAVGMPYAGENETYIFQRDDGLVVGLYCLYNDKTPTKDLLDAGLKKLREGGAQFTIAALHWGVEGAYSVSDVQVSMGRYAIDAGFNVVYGSHPHRLEPVEQYGDGLIFYSMANWSFGGHTDPSDYDTAIAQVVVKRQGDQVSIDTVKLIPCSISSSGDINNYCPTPYAEDSEEWKRVLQKLDGTFEGGDFIPDYQSLIYGTT